MNELSPRSDELERLAAQIIKGLRIRVAVIAVIVGFASGMLGLAILKLL